MPKIYKFPKALGACADRLYELREKRLAAQKLTDEIDAEEKAMKEHLISTLPKSKASGVAGKFVRVTVVTKTVPRVDNWDKFYGFVKKTGRFDLMQRRLSDAAITEIWEAGKKIPGVDSFKYATISMNKL
jgi:hypothetical protein